MTVLIAYTSVYYIFLWLGEQVKIALSFADEGGDFVFASYDQYGKQHALAGIEPTMVNVTMTDAHGVKSLVTVVNDVSFRSMGGNFAIGVLPSIIFFSAFVEVMNHIGVLPWFMKIFASIFCFFTGCNVPEGGEWTPSSYCAGDFLWFSHRFPWILCVCCQSPRRRMSSLG